MTPLEEWTDRELLTALAGELERIGKSDWGCDARRAQAAALRRLLALPHQEAAQRLQPSLLDPAA